MKIVQSVIWILIVPIFLQAESDSLLLQRWLQKKNSYVSEVRMMFQLWGLYSTGMEIYNTTEKRYEQVDDRLNFSFRRARIVFSGEPYSDLRYTVALFYDQVGRDFLSAGVGVANRADPSVGLWDAFLQWRAEKKGHLYITGGWFRPQMQRESITSAWMVNSFEKSMSQNYVRTHLVGTGPGRAMGVNIGGLAGKEPLVLNYNAGIFVPVTAVFSGTSVGKKFAPLYAGRVSLSIGQPEFRQYGINYIINFLSERKGISIDFNFSHQGETDVFSRSLAWGPGFLLNYSPLNLGGEWTWMQRTHSSLSLPVKAGSGHLRAGYNLQAGRFILEPAFMVMHFEGSMKKKEQEDAVLLGMSSGRETTFDAGINWYLDGNFLKLLLHYTWRTGQAGELGDGSQPNMFFSQNGIGAIRRGNWLGLGIHAIF